MSLVYIAGHFKRDDYRAAAIPALEGLGYSTLNPFRPEHDLRGAEDGASSTIVKWDLEDVVACDHVLANFTNMSVGTSMECWFAHSIGRPVFSFVDGDDVRISPWIEYISVKVDHSLDDAVANLDWYAKFA